MDYFKKDIIINYYNNNLLFWISKNQVNDNYFEYFLLNYLGNDSRKLINNIESNIILLVNLSELLNNNNKYNISNMHNYLKLLIIKQINKYNLITDFLYRDIFTPKITNTFDLIFVRHGLSCANVVHEEKGRQFRGITKENTNDKLDEIFDPQLTKSGIERSIKLSSILINKIKEIWKEEPYTIGTSYLMRTQQTAYYMLSKETNNKINIFPHIAEFNYSKGTGEFAFSREKQKEIYSKIEPDILNKLGEDWRRDQTMLDKNDKLFFFNWLNNNIDKFKIGSDGVYRLVIFTHGGYLGKYPNGLFKLWTVNKLNPNLLYMNNQIIHTKINKDLNINEQIDFKDDNKDENLLNKFTYVPIEPVTDDMYICPDNCPNSLCK
jgi:hypothetical protein